MSALSDQVLANLGSLKTDGFHLSLIILDMYDKAQFMKQNQVIDPIITIYFSQSIQCTWKHEVQC